MFQPSLRLVNVAENIGGLPDQSGKADDLVRLVGRQSPGYFTPLQGRSRDGKLFRKLFHWNVDLVLQILELAKGQASLNAPNQRVRMLRLFAARILFRKRSLHRLTF